MFFIHVLPFSFDAVYAPRQKKRKNKTAYDRSLICSSKPGEQADQKEMFAFCADVPSSASLLAMGEFARMNFSKRLFQETFKLR